ncbi:MAG: WYL domain-containing transcriptional regulator [Treponemataceae bacterium]|nr:MAG: WYL domain-containing transcriptional regulator [Treponemataceae bacterium]
MSVVSLYTQDMKKLNNNPLNKHIKADKVKELMPQYKEQKVRTNRILMIDNAIRSGTFPNAMDLARSAEVSVRTIWRDIDYLRDMYLAPIEFDREKNGYFYTDANFFIKSLLLTEGDLFSLTLCDKLLMQYRNTPLEENLRALFKKIIASMPAQVTVDTDFLSPHVSFIPTHAPDIQITIFKTVFASLQHHITLTFDYHTVSRTSFIQFTVDPYHAIYHSGMWYIIGYCHYNKKPIIFAFSRMRNAALTENKFTVPSDFNPDDYFDKEIGIWLSERTPFSVELLFDSSIVTIALEQYWNKTQRITQHPDGQVQVQFTTTQLHEVQRRVLGFGSMVKVLNPPELVIMLKDEITKLQEKYK